MEPTSTTPAPSLNVLYAYAHMCAQSDFTPHEIKAGLLEKGATEAEVVEILGALAIDIQRRQQQAPTIKRDLSRSTMKKGALWLLGGSVVTGISYANASEGGVYMVTSGAILYGAYLIVVGFFSR